MRAADFHKFQQSGENVCVEFKRGGNGAQKDTFSVTVPLNDGYSPEVGFAELGKGGVPESGDDGTASGLKSGPLSGLKSGLNATDSKLMEFIRSNPSMTIQELQGKLNLSRDGVRKALGRLKTTGRIRRIGPDKGGHWEIVE